MQITPSFRFSLLSINWFRVASPTISALAHTMCTAHLVHPSLNSYISAISEVIVDEGETCLEAAKNNMGESRLDIIDSEVNRESCNKCIRSC